ncbi:MAG: NAD(P)H-dependent glycerol-3-phosphate dehydrogenase [Lachnospiraceae bacterium]|nr:NAD(P)H-dependent glycerol-3-phosphate dehydrogenase [Lachnospiraceae bacterium]
MAKVGILGAGAWGIALGLVLHKNGHQVTMWTCVESEAEMLLKDREHKSSLPGVKLPEDMKITMDIEEAVKGMDLVVMAVASRFTRETAAKLKNIAVTDQKILNVSKGIEDTTLMTLTEVILDEVPIVDVAVLSGPSHAEEVGRGLPTTVVAGASRRETAVYIQELFMNDVFRVYTSPDVKGMELGGALKNVIALAAGIADGAGCGDNTKAALITRGIAEISRLGVKMGGNINTFSGLSGIGDLIVTCASMHSRNRRAGILIGQGKSMDEAMTEVHAVVEGVYSAKAAYKLAEKYQVSMPIVEQVNKVLFEGKDVRQALQDLMKREKRDEIIEGWK